MAMKALSHQMSRTVRVKRSVLLDTLKKNREKHLAVYTAAMAGYKELALRKIDEAFAGLGARLEARKAEMVAHIGTFSDETADKFSDFLVILQQVAVDLKKPVSYVEAYDAAIDIAQYDTREELDLSGAEFQCFFRDVWDWTYEFATVNSAYAAGFARP